MNGIILISVIILLAVIIISWLASYRAPKVDRSKDWFFTLPPRVQIAGGLIACALFVYLGYLLWRPLPLPLSPMTLSLLRIAGLSLFLTGWFLVLWARWVLGSLYGVSTSFAAPLQVQHRLVQHRPYAVVRHPMYLGYWLLLPGLILVYRTWTPLLFLAVCLVSFYRRARLEDIVLAERFGQDWQAYAERTKFLIPWVH